MQTLAKNIIAQCLLVFALAFATVQGSAFAQDRPAATQQQLDRILAPIALYPDALLSQILMASTYPLEVVQAARWSRNHPRLAGDDAVRAVEDEDWDPSVKSLVAFPQILERMDENLQWTQALGDAFLDQEPQVMDTVQNLRRRAAAVGNLRSNDRIRVNDSGQTVIVEYVNPEVIYVPYYDPMVVYGNWWWPDYRPVYWRPWPGYYAQPGFAFYWGPPIGISAGFFFGNFDWYHRQARVVQVNNYYYNRRDGIVNRQPGMVNVNRGPGYWQHDPDHRRGVAYRSVEAQQRFGGANMPHDMTRRDPNRYGPVVTPDRGNHEERIEQRRPESVPRWNAQPQPQVQSPANVPGGNHDRSERSDHGDRNMRFERRPETQSPVAAPETRENRGRQIEIRPQPDADSARFRSQPPVGTRGNPQEDRHQRATPAESPRTIEPSPARTMRPQGEVHESTRPATPQIAAPQAMPPQAQPQAPAEKKQERPDGPRNFRRDKQGND